MNNKFLLAIILLILVMAVLFIYLLQSNVELSEIKIANGNPFFLFIATEKGFFEKEELQVTLEMISPENSVSALLAGKIDYAFFYGLSAKPAIEVSLKNAPIKTILLTTRYQIGYIITQSELEINDLKTIGIITNSPVRYQVLKFIEENNLETKIITLKKTSRGTLNNLLITNNIDALSFVIDEKHVLRFQGQDFSIYNVVDVLPSGLAARNDKIEKNSEEIQKVIRALEQTMYFVVTEPEETKKLLLKFWSLEETKENLAITEEYYSLLKESSDRRNAPHDEEAELLIKIIKAGEFKTLEEVEEQVVTQEELDKVFDFRFVK